MIISCSVVCLITKTLNFVYLTTFIFWATTVYTLTFLENISWEKNMTNIRAICIWNVCLFPWKDRTLLKINRGGFDDKNVVWIWKLRSLKWFLWGMIKRLKLMRSRLAFFNFLQNWSGDRKGPRGSLLQVVFSNLI
jgi:hypothetical protein